MPFTALKENSHLQDNTLCVITNKVLLPGPVVVTPRCFVTALVDWCLEVIRTGLFILNNYSMKVKMEYGVCSSIIQV